MKTIKLNILASDILENDYFNNFDCAITRALKRAGEDMTDSTLASKTDCGRLNESYRLLLEKVLGMYGKLNNRIFTYGFGISIKAPLLPIEDFEHELII